MGIFPVRASAERIPQQDRPRDMAKMLRENTDRGDPVDEIEAADQYGKRPTRYEHQEIVLSNEYIAMIEHIDRTMEGLIGEVSKLTEYARALKDALHVRVIDLTVLVQREKAVVVDLQGHFQDLHARITETRNAKTTPTPRSNGNGNCARTNSSGEPHDGEELQHASDEESAPATQAPARR